MVSVMLVCGASSKGHLEFATKRRHSYSHDETDRLLELLTGRTVSPEGVVETTVTTDPVSHFQPMPKAATTPNLVVEKVLPSEQSADEGKGRVPDGGPSDFSLELQPHVVPPSPPSASLSVLGGEVRHVVMSGGTSRSMEQFDGGVEEVEILATAREHQHGGWRVEEYTNEQPAAETLPGVSSLHLSASESGAGEDPDGQSSEALPAEESRAEIAIRDDGNPVPVPPLADSFRKRLGIAPGISVTEEISAEVDRVCPLARSFVRLANALCRTQVYLASRHLRLSRNLPRGASPLCLAGMS